MKTRIVCTIGPAARTDEMLEKLIKAGMGVARFNCSHDTVEGNRKFMERVQQVRDRLKSGTIVMLDTKGPDVRLGTFKEHSVTVTAGQTFTLYFGDRYRNFPGTKDGVFVPYEKFPRIVKVGAKLGLNDGTVVMTVTNITKDTVTAHVEAGGVLKDRKALAAPGFDLELPFISEEDEHDLKMGCEVGVDWVAASAVSRAGDVTEMRKLLKQWGGEHIKIISKIEDRIGMANLDAIIAASDGIMVARGGLGSDLPMEQLPVLQKIIIAKTRAAGKIAITATMMMESMIEKSSPTRAEISDIANAVWDGSTHVMLSAETASGKYPIETVEFMARAAAYAEKHPEYNRI